MPSSPSIIGTSTQTGDNVSGIDITLPGGISSGDLIVIFCSCNATISTPTGGYTNLHTDYNVFHKVSGGSDSGATVTLSWGSKQYAAALAVVIGDGFVDTGSTLAGSTSPGATSTVTYTLVLRASLYNTAGADFTPSDTIPSGTSYYTAIGNFDGSEKDAVVTLATETKASSGVINTAAWTKGDLCATVVVGGPDSVGGGGGGGSGSAILLGV